jgi:hypothetical protein
MTQDTDAQEEELQVLSAVYGEDLTTSDQSIGGPGDAVVHEFKLTTPIARVVLLFSYPPDYPSKSPPHTQLAEFQSGCSCDLTENRVVAQAYELWQNNDGEVMMFELLNWLRDEISLEGGDSISDPNGDHAENILLFGDTLVDSEDAIKREQQKAAAKHAQSL